MLRRRLVLSYRPRADPILSPPKASRYVSLNQRCESTLKPVFKRSRAAAAVSLDDEQVAGKYRRYRSAPELESASGIRWLRLSWVAGAAESAHRPGRIIGCHRPSYRRAGPAARIRAHRFRCSRVRTSRVFLPRRSYSADESRARTEPYSARIHPRSLCKTCPA